MKTFPNAWGRITEVTATPVGVMCLACNVPIREGDVGLVMPHMGPTEVTEQPWHRSCFLAAMGVDVGRA